MMLHRQRRACDRDNPLHHVRPGFLPAVHVSSDEPSKATDEHTFILIPQQTQPKAPFSSVRL
ncbi:hypothetical protein EMIT048CA2_200052 [Pseudomonas chlororaphis]